MHNFHMKALYETQIQGKSRLKSLKQLRQIPYVNNSNLKEQTKLAQIHLLQILEHKIQQDNKRAQNEQMYETFYNKNKNKSHNQNQNQNSSSKLSLSNKKKKSINHQQQNENQHNIHLHNNKLFQYFQHQYYTQIPLQKVQRQKINFLQRLFLEIKQKIKERIIHNQQKTKQTEQKLTKKYIEMHQGYEDIKKIKSKIKEIKRIENQQEQEKNNDRKRSLLQNSHSGYSNMANMTNMTNTNMSSSNHIKLPRNSQLSNTNTPSHFNPALTLSSSIKPSAFASSSHPAPKQNLSTMSLKPPSYRQKLLILQQTIQYQKCSIDQLQQQIKLLRHSYQQIKQEWIGFLKLFLYKGYYLIHGVEEIFKEMKMYKVQLRQSDFDKQIIDDIAVKFMLRSYHYFGSIHDNNKHKYNSLHNHNMTLNNSRNAPSSTQFSRCKAYSQIQTNTLLKQSNLKSIYSTTKQMMTNLLKDSNFKSIQNNSFLPKINLKTKQKESIPHKKLPTLQAQPIQKHNESSGYDQEKSYKQIEQIINIVIMRKI